ncbi:MAG: hypothetical protein ACLQPD_07980 [Desulfomonilaceae bacterium]
MVGRRRNRAASFLDLICEAGSNSGKLDIDELRTRSKKLLNKNKNAPVDVGYITVVSQEIIDQLTEIMRKLETNLKYNRSWDKF